MSRRREPRAHGALRGHGRLFWRVYRHGLLLVLLVGLTTFGVGWLLRPDTPFLDLHERMAKYLAAHLEAERLTPEALNREVGQVHDILGLDLTVYDASGAVVASSVEPPLTRPTEAMTGAGTLATWHQDRRLLLATLLTGGGLAVARSPRWAPAPFYVQLGAILACLSALALGSFPLARGIVRPLERLTETARALGRGDYSVRSRLCAPGEVGTLAQAFDEMAERIQRQMATEKALLANVSHELRTPLSRIRVALELAAPPDSDGSGGESRYLQEIAMDLDELDRLLGDILTTVRLDAAPPLNRERVGAEVLLTRAVERFRGLFPDRVLNVMLAAELPMLDADPVMLRRVVDNLLDNARKYSDGEIALTAARTADGRGLEVSVRDTGIGLSEADRAQLFTPFFRSDASRARTSGGVGLGLALAKRIVEAHGGGIEVESQPGAGATFRFRVPGFPAS